MEADLNRTFTNELIKLESLSLVERALINRREEILTAIAEKRVAPSKELMLELCELNIAIGDVEVAP